MLVDSHCHLDHAKISLAPEKPSVAPASPGWSGS